MNCLDAETLAAWMDEGLRGAALEDVRAHVAGCERCQLMLGAMGRTRAAIPAPAPERAPRRWLAWAVPLTAAATALAVWVAIPEQKTVPVVAPATAPLAKEEAPAPAPPPASPAPSASTETRQANPRAIAQAPVQQSQSNDVAAPPAAPPPAAAAPAAEPSAAAPLLAPGPEARVLDQQGRAAVQAPATESVTTTAESATGSAIQSLCGRRWSAPPGDVIGVLTAGSSPSPNVCWVVGRGGVVQRSTNGQTWQRIPFPEMTDLSGVQASDARSARVSTADGRSFRTSDAGMTWVPQ